MTIVFVMPLVECRRGSALCSTSLVAIQVSCENRQRRHCEFLTIQGFVYAVLGLKLKVTVSKPA